MKPAYARLHILLAREAPLGLVIRHGTAKSVCTLLWDRQKDRFTLGQWMRGRIEISTCDLSPDGEHFIYAAEKYVHPDLVGWTAVSRAPYLKALAYYRRCWGGWFLNNFDYCARGDRSELDDRESPEVRRVESEPPSPSLYAARLVRDGWQMDGREFVRAAGSGWELRMYPAGGYRLSCGELVANTTGWEWAGVDGKRLVWTVKGCLWAGVMRKDGIHEVKLLHDFNGMKFEALAAPYEGGRPVRPKPAPKPAPPSFAPVKKGSRKPLRKKPNRSKVRPDEDE